MKNFKSVKESVTFNFLTRQKPEVLLLIPKDEVAASKELPNLLKDIRDIGFKAEFAELGATNDEFENTARTIYNEWKGGK